VCVIGTGMCLAAWFQSARLRRRERGTATLTRAPQSVTDPMHSSDEPDLEMGVTTPTPVSDERTAAPETIKQTITSGRSK
jgi:hypothetical protein